MAAVIGTHLSLFSGYGGLDLAAAWAGFETVGLCEWADFQHGLLQKRFPGVAMWRDIRTLTKESFCEQTGLQTVDIISGGFPCQPFSAAGQRRGKADDRYLWPEMLRVINEIRPAWVVAENVAGIISMAEPATPFAVESKTIFRTKESDSYEAILSREENMLLAGIVQDIESIAYRAEIYLLPACGVGACHQRYRIFIVCHAEHAGQVAAEKRGSIGAGDE